jgi:two-component system sensor histidine kinase/response regulator
VLEKELVAAREAALAASRTKSEFLSSMSHEIRTPMNAILGMADLLAEDPALTTEEHRYVETMRSNGNALLHLINDILDLAKIESGKLSLEAIGFDLEEVVERTLQTMSVRAHGKGLELTTRIMPEVPHNLIGDPLRLGQILINLIGNAIKFTEDGEVGLTVATESASADDAADAVRLRFSISDTGIGIPADKLATIFSGFSQADASITRRFGGSGLGLTIVTRLTKLMAGSVDVQSEVGRGSTFSFTVALPRDPQPPAVLSRKVARLDGLHILIVDDNDTNRLILREMLIKEGARPSEAVSGEAALAELARARVAGSPYRVMLLDYRMPGIDGAEVARRVLSERRTRTSDGANPLDKTMILMLTSEDLNTQLAKLREMGLRTYLVKPIRRIELLETIGRLLTSDGAVSVPSAPTRSTTEARHERSLRILLADDSPDNCLLIRAYFKTLPWKIEVADNGLLAIEKFKASAHDLVLMDVRMPEMDGLTATRVIRNWEETQGLPATPIIALTASALAEDVARSLTAGCDAHVSKPVRKATLIEAIRALTARTAEGIGTVAALDGPAGA